MDTHIDLIRGFITHANRVCHSTKYDIRDVYHRKINDKRVTDRVTATTLSTTTSHNTHVTETEQFAKRYVITLYGV